MYSFINQMRKAAIFTLLFLATPLLTLAQVVEKTGEEAEKAAKAGEKISALEFVMKGGVFIIPIIILLFYTLYVVIERYRYIKRMSVYNSNLLNDIRMNLEKGNIQDALNTVQRDQSAFGSVVAEGIQTPAGLNTLKGFDFNNQALLSSLFLLRKAYSVKSCCCNAADFSFRSSFNRLILLVNCSKFCLASSNL